MGSLSATAGTIRSHARLKPVPQHELGPGLGTRGSRETIVGMTGLAR
jgi:hypothetical protein